ncbi:signal transducer and activator of transcription A-like [Gossypium australe]|uniref:Signal transducer and activator of transcription A-like n=1 Tax=Gossypium australe TaxID=47621 RepID=A0A5B6X2Q3_9ROSI|nr:signal transducer and activator of transcription A-like [Gossypium australe]
MENTDNLQEEPLKTDNKQELEEVVRPKVEPKKETIKELALKKKQKRDEDEFLSFLNLFKTLNVNLPLIELIEKVPKYAKFLKEIISRHRKIKVGEQVNMSTSYSAIISRQVPQKLKDPLANKSSVHPKGILDVLVKLRNFIIQTEFVVLDFEEDREIPILLGRPFLASQDPPLIWRKMN